MSRINDEWLQTVGFIYPTRQEAEHPAGSSIGGTGFLMSIKSTVIERVNNTYFVTNAHVLERLREKQSVSAFVRFNKSPSSTDIVEVPLQHWQMHPNGDDIAVCLIEDKAEWVSRWVAVEDHFLTPEMCASLQVGIGDQTVTVGRFSAYSGGLANIPSARFGRIAMNGVEPIKQSNRGSFEQQSFLVETYSISGYSGSPVFVEIEPTSFVPERRDSRAYLLGVDWGHFNIALEHDEHTIPTGMMGVVPAWKIVDIIMQPMLVQAREAGIEDWKSAYDSLGVEYDAVDMADDLVRKINTLRLRNRGHRLKQQESS